MKSKILLVGMLIHVCSMMGQPLLKDWLLKTDGRQYAWVTGKYQWGYGYLFADGKKYEWGADGIAGPIRISVLKKTEETDLVETYTFTNTSKNPVQLSCIGIYTPFNDNYPDARICMTGRVNTHVWPGGKSAYVNAIRMNGEGNQLTLLVTEGAVTDYDIWERGQQKGKSNFRGVFALCPPDIMLKPGKNYRLSWRIFLHSKGELKQQILKRGGIYAESDKYVYKVGEVAKVNFYTEKRIKTVQKKVTNTGELNFNYQGATASVYGVSDERELIKKRVDFILNHQQMNNVNDKRYGAFMVYDNEGDSILTNCFERSDLDEGRERVGMGVLLAEYCMRNPNSKVVSALERYACFIRHQLQDENYKTTSSVTRKVKNRGYNYAWIADFYFRMYLLTGERQYARDGYNTMRALYRMFGYGFYCIDYPVTVGLKALKQSGMVEEYKLLLSDFCQTGDIFLKNGLNFPHHEVNYEQSIIAPAIQLLCELYLATGSKQYLNGAKMAMPALEAFNGSQPNYRMNGVAIRHWDGFWFGKRQMYGDVFPHYWSTISAGAFHYYALATGNLLYQRKAENIVRNNLCLFSENGKATCAFINPRMVDGVEAHYADAYANDQDWALVFYLLVNSSSSDLILKP